MSASDWSSSGRGGGGGSSGSGSGGSGSGDRQIMKQILSHQKMKTLRQILIRSPNRGSVMALDLFYILKYLPVGVMNKMQQLTASFSNNTQSHKTEGGGGKGHGESEGASSSGGDAGSGPGSGKDSDKDKDKAIKTTPAGTPLKKLEASPIKIEQSQPPSVLRNAVEIKSRNNRVIEQKMLEDLSREQLGHGKVSEVVAGQEPHEKVSSSAQLLEATLHWQNMESRTKHLISQIEKYATSKDSKHTLITHLDELFSHMYQHHETRSSAVEAGALKALTKVQKYYADSTSIIYRTREILALLGNNPPSKGQGIKILSIDGGGVRGLVALEVLRAIENVTGKRIYQLFDYICGVSTGSILAVLLGAHKKTLDECEVLYKDLSQEIFSQNSIFGSASLLWTHSYYHTPTFEKILKKHCGELPLINLARDPTLPRVSAISTIVNQERVQAYVFRTYTFPPSVRPKYLGGCRYLMWEAVRASAAAPTYFEEFKLGSYLHQDGGVLCNNPTSVAISEARVIWPDQPLQSVVSVGTGLTLSSRTDKNLNELIEHDKQGASYLSWKGKFLKVLDSATDTESVHTTLHELLPHSIYFRFNPYLSELLRLDEAQPDRLDQVQAETRAYLARNVDKVQFACKTLLREKGYSKRLIDWWYHA